LLSAFPATRSAACMTIFGINSHRKIAQRSMPRPPAPWTGSTTGQRPLPSMTTSSTIPRTSPRAGGSRRPWPTCRGVRYPRLRWSRLPHHPVLRPGRRPGLARPGPPHRNDDARHRQNPAQQTGGAPWHRYRMTRTSPAGCSSSARLNTQKPDGERPA
jgi:hypothetical protein